MSKGNKKARGTKGNKGGTGRPPKTEGERLTKVVSFRVSDALWERINVSALENWFDNYGDFLREFLDINLPDNKSNEAYSKDAAKFG